MPKINNIRNIAIIAHVDHGKTTLVDQLLKYSGTLDPRAKSQERAMDSMILKESAVSLYYQKILRLPGMITRLI
jgi:GTP-binding protein